MKRLISKFILALAIVAASITCSKTSSDQKSLNNEKEGLIFLSKQHFETEKMKVGQAQSMAFKNSIKTNGYITAEPNSIAKISSILPGRVEAIYCTVGEKVSKGDKLVALSTPALIELQQDYMKTLAVKKQVETDFIRKKKLYDENIGTEKEYLALESEFSIVKANYEALSLKLKLLKLDVNQIEKGHLYTYYPVLAPIEGEITMLNIVLGDYVEPQKDIAELVNMNHLQLALAVYEKDVGDIKKGNSVVYHSLGDSEMEYSAILTTIAKRVDEESKTLECKANVKMQANVNYAFGAYVRARIIIDEVEAVALPISAFVKQGDSYYIFLVKEQIGNDFYLEKKEVTVVQSSKDFLGIKDDVLNNKVLVSGVYNLPID